MKVEVRTVSLFMFVGAWERGSVGAWERGSVGVLEQYLEYFFLQSPRAPVPPRLICSRSKHKAADANPCKFE